ncbi:MAG: hypothetical protein Q4G19_08600, partial [Clostridia bacterium]|nr:hypothetical protein [Clostridia bacterium]
DDPDDSDPDARFEAKVDALLSDPEVREQLIATIGIGITVQVVDLLLKNSGHTEAEIYRFLEMDKDMIEEVKMARQMIHAAEEDELSKQRNKKKKK